ncbi:hypothetical protein C7C46_26015 [Streptomyces tateyamensis]|uniref:DUF4190 domain-containing protein n=1 Tax=Streptomyces tateyamensis TaxID=565073 RepID=A0A2V4N7I2_9ACTN|nr:DUF4190 domain-containing protein [Streptomyces tateyamensis]PYC72097.1 hypothetical protein C7C46_26015 [Streptomyces tateyamensis]
MTAEQERAADGPQDAVPADCAPPAPQPYPAGPPQVQPYPVPPQVQPYPVPPQAAYPPYQGQGPGPYPPAPGYPVYGGYPGGYPGWGTPPPPPGTNGLAIGALVTALTCFLWPVGLGLSIGALNQIRKRGGQRGTGLAVAALILSVLGAFTTLGSLAGKNSGHNDFSLGGGSGTVAARDLSTGDCFDRAGSLVRKVPCSTAHDGEVVGSLQLTGSGFPDEAERRRQAGPGCQRFSLDYSMDDWAFPDGMVVHYFYPEQGSWDTGDRTATCFLTDPDKKHTGTMRLDASTATSAQYRYLKAMDAIDTVGSRRPSGSVADDPAGYREWAADMAKVLQEQTAALQGGWDPAVGPAVDAQTAELKLRIPGLQRAARPTGPDDLARALAEADQHRGYDQQKAVRKLLKLSTDDSWQNQPAGSDGAPKSV